MNVQPEKFANLLGAAAGKVLRVSRRQLSVSMECPLHSDGETSLSCSPGPKVVFSCSSPSCRFRGDAASLVSMALKVPLSESVAMFSDGGAFSECMAEPMTAEAARSYLETANSQAVLKAWLAKARARLRNFPEKSGLRAGMSRLNARLLHPDVGLFTVDGDNEETPKCLREFEKPKYAKSRLLLFPYTMDGEVTRIDVTDALDPKFRKTVVVTHPTAGVFGEELVASSASGAILAAERPDVAAKLYAAWAAGSTKTPPIVAFSGYPLPETFRNVTNLDIVSTADDPVSTELIVRTLSAPEIKAGRQPNMHVIDWRMDTAEVRFEDLSNPRGSRAVADLQYMAAKRFAAMVKAGDSGKVLETLASEQAPSYVCSLLKSTAEGQLSLRNGFEGDAENTGKLVDVLASSDCGEPCSVSLANGKTLHCGPDGVFAVRVSGAREAIANVGLSVDSRIVREDGGEAFSCTVAARGGFPAVKARFEWRDLTADGMRSVVQKAYSDLGLSPYVAFYSASGFSWRDVMSKLAENCPVERDRPADLRPVGGGSPKLKPLKPLKPL